MIYFIAGLARSRDMTLVTNNAKEFERIHNLHVENWVEAVSGEPRRRKEREDGRV